MESDEMIPIEIKYEGEDIDLEDELDEVVELLLPKKAKTMVWFGLCIYVACPLFLLLLWFFFFYMFCFRQGTIITVHVLSSTVHTL